ncbi:MAG: SpoIID/LytB domain-containing protein, partial [Actinomycetota bacterium]
MVSTSTAAAATATPRVAVGDLVLDGHGNGHGFGLSQWGAYGYAVDRGWTAAQILDHYYGGTVASTVPLDTGVSVRLQRLDDLQTAVVSKTGGLIVAGVAGGPWQSVLAREVSPSVYSVWARSDAEVCPAATGDPVAAGWKLVAKTVATKVDIHTTVDSSATTNFADLASVCEPSGTVRSYRGFIRAVNGPVGEHRTVNIVPIEQYLRAVIAMEMSPGWATAGGGRGLQALEAQAVAARSYPLSSTWYTYADVCDLYCQAYFGAAWRAHMGAGFTRVEYPATDSAVQATAGVVRRVKATTGPIALTMFAASTGGWTQAGSSPIMPFPAVVDAGDSTALNPYYRWSVTLTATAIAARYPSIGVYTGITFLSRNGLGDWGGRVGSMRVNGTISSVTVTGDQFRSAFGLRSNWFVEHGTVVVSPCAGRVAPAMATLAVAAASRFSPSTPTRIVDTRSGVGTTASPLAAGCTMVVKPNVGPTVTAVAVNFTSVKPATAGGLVAYPCGVTRPATSTVQFVAGRVVAGMTVVRLSAARTFCVYATSATDLVIDLQGTYAPSIGAKFQPITPVRLVDTRSVPGALRAGSVLHISARGAGRAPVAATAVALTVHATEVVSGGVVTVFACSATVPTVSSLNAAAGVNVTNHVEVALSNIGEICVYVSSPMEIVVDLSGWFGAGATTEYHPIAPVRVVDTRSGFGGRAGALSAEVNQPFLLAGKGGLPSASVLKAPMATLSVVGATSTGYLVVDACQATPPAVSMVRYSTGINTSTTVTGPVDASGHWCVSPVTAVQIVID